MKKRRKYYKGLRFLGLLVLFLTVISFAGIGFLSHRSLDLTLTPNSLQLSNEYLRQPYCGWYKSYSYQLADDMVFADADVTTALKTDNTTRLCLLSVNLAAYKDGPISETGLQLVDSILSAWSFTDKELLLRFSYGSSASRTLLEPAELSTVYLHMEQLAPIVNPYASSIYELQGAFVGSDASGLQSQLIEDNDTKEILQYMDALFSPSITIAIQGADQYNQLLQATDESFMQRFSIYQNDLSHSVPADITKRYQILSETKPIGGSMEMDDTLFDVEQTLALLKQLHLSYLNSVEDEELLKSWKSIPYREDPVFSGVTLYDYISTHLGYRYCIKQLSLQFDTWHDETAKLKFSLENTGFSKAYHLFDSSIILRNPETEEMLSFPLNADNRTWFPGEAVDFDINLDVRHMETGEYTIYFDMIDASTGEVIQLGNAIPLSPYGYEIGSLVIK